MSILGKYESYLGFSQAALDIKARRVQVISENIVNASTPNYRAKDINFDKILGDRMKQAESNNHASSFMVQGSSTSFSAERRALGARA